MKTIYLDSGMFKDSADIHEYLQSELEFPEYYGKNLAALFDCMTDICEETVIRYHLAGAGSEEYFFKVLMVIKDAAAENDLLVLEEVE